MGVQYRGKDVTQEQFFEKLEENKGGVYKTCSDLGISYNRYKKWREEDPNFTDKVLDIKNLTTQWVESKMFDKIEEGDGNMIRFYLGSQAGYNSGLNVNVSTAGVVDIQATIKHMIEQLSEDEE